MGATATSAQILAAQILADKVSRLDNVDIML